MTSEEARIADLEAEVQRLRDAVGALERKIAGLSNQLGQIIKANSPLKRR